MIKNNSATVNANSQETLYTVDYKIVSFKPNFNDAGESAVKVRVGNSAKTFFCLVKNIYNTEWIKYLSKEDCTYLASVYVSDKENKPEIVKQYPRKNLSISINVIILAALYTGIFILSNIADHKIINISSITLTAGLFVFPLTFILDDVITEVYGFKVGRAIIMECTNSEHVSSAWYCFNSTIRSI